MMDSVGFGCVTPWWRVFLGSFGVFTRVFNHGFVVGERHVLGLWGPGVGEFLHVYAYVNVHVYAYDLCLCLRLHLSLQIYIYMYVCMYMRM